MTDHTQFEPPPQLGIALLQLEMPAAVCQDPHTVCDICQNERQDQCQKPRRDNSRMGKPRMAESTMEVKRFRVLIKLLTTTPGHPEFGVMTETAIAKLIGMSVSYVNKFKNEDRDRGVGSSIIRQTMKGLKIDPKFFYEDDEPKDLKLYILSEKRIEKAVINHEARLTKQQEQIVRQQEQLQALQSALEEIKAAKPDPEAATVRKIKR